MTPKKPRTTQTQTSRTGFNELVSPTPTPPYEVILRLARRLEAQNELLQTRVRELEETLARLEHG